MSSKMIDIKSELYHICDDHPISPMDFFKQLIEDVGDEVITMNLATIDDEYGVLNRSVLYKGLTEGCITLVTQKDTRKYENIMKNPKVAVTFLLPKLRETENEHLTRQIRINGYAEEIEDSDVLSTFWQDEPIFAKIRNYLSECGKPIDWFQQKKAHDQILREVENGRVLNQPSKFTVVKIIPQMMDFYESCPNSIADRVQYRKEKDGLEEWKMFHVAA